MIRSVDLHGKKLEPALELVEQMIGEIRLQGWAVDLKVITGRGVIRKELIKYLEIHEIEYRFEMGNDGVIFIYVD